METGTLVILACIFCFGLGAIFSRGLGKKLAGTDNSNLESSVRTAFLFDGDDLIDMTESGRQLLAGLENYGTAKQNLIALCISQYPDLAQTWDELQTMESKVLRDVQTGVCDLEISKIDDRVTLRILDGPEHRGQTIQEDLLASRVQFLSDVIEKSPYLIWRERESGDLLWSNKKYDDFLEKKTTQQRKAVSALSKNRIFPDLPMPNAAAEVAIETRQYFVDKVQSEEHWFNIVSFPTQDGSLHYGSDANDTVAADRAQKATLRTFVQIFAQLSIGFAIFDESRQLKIYNPALSELTGLDPIFLSSRPTLTRVLEEMRHTDKAPEPKDYSNFRQTIRDLEAAASSGTYEAVWTLADDQSLRVTGRPYQGGSLAFLIEDVSSELSITRKYRTEIQTHQDLVDCFEEPIFMFSSSGALITSNECGTQILQNQDDASVTTFEKFASAIRRRALPSNGLKELLSVQKHNFDDTLHIHFFDGRGFDVVRHNLSGGFFAVRFSNQKSPQTEIRNIFRSASIKQAQ